MQNYKAPDNTQPSGFSLHALSAQDIANGGESYLPAGFEAITDEAAEVIRTQNNNVESVPYSVTMRQARLVLLQAGKLELVNSAIASMQGMAGDAARIEWNYSNEVRRNQPLTIQLAQVIGMTNEEMDSLFIAASKI